MNTWTCPKCPHSIAYAAGQYETARDTMLSHIEDEHPVHYRFIKFVTAMSAD